MALDKPDCLAVPEDAQREAMPRARVKPGRRRCRSSIVAIALLVGWLSFDRPTALAGEPAEDFLKRLRAAGYHDIAIRYIDRLEEFPGVDANLLDAVALEKAQIHIDAAVSARNPAARDESFVAAEKELAEFLKLTSHPRISEARLQLGKLQMVRAAQLLSGKVDEEKRKLARESYLAAAKTFDAIVDNLREQLTQMQGQRIDAAKEPEKAAQRDTYRFEFLQGQLNAGESRRLAARTYEKPAQEGKALLEESLQRFDDLTEKYSNYVQGAVAMLYRGQVLQDLGDSEKALDSYLRMLEQPDADPLRDSKFQATSGLIQLHLAESPPKFQQAIERGQAMLDSVRPDEKRSQSVQQLRLDLAKAYLAKAADKENQKPADLKRAASEGRRLLLDASKVAGVHVEESQALLATLGVSQDEEVPLPTADDPKNFDEAFVSAKQLFEAAESLQQSLGVLEKQTDAAEQIEEVKKQLAETRAVAIIVLGRGLSMVTPETGVSSVNQARQILAYLLYQQQRYREAAVVGSFLAKQSPGNEGGLRGGLIGLTSLQLLFADTPEESNEGLVRQIQELGAYLASTWPDDPQATAAQGIMIRLALSKDQWDEAKALVSRMPAGSERASFQRLIGQLLWNKSVQLYQSGSESEAKQRLAEAEANLTAGLEGLSGKLVDPEALQAALVLAKVYLRQDQEQRAIETLDHPTYGPLLLVDKQGAPNETFKSDLYATELQAVVGRMTSPDGDPQALLERATATMEKLRNSVTGDDKQTRLVGVYLGLARDIQGQLDQAPPARKAKLTDAFRVFLSRVGQASSDPGTLQWVGQTLLEMGESSMNPGEGLATGQAADLIGSAADTFESLRKTSAELPLTVDYQLARSYRLLGRYKEAIDTLEKILRQKPMMLDAQIEAATAYEKWAGETKPELAGRAYQLALDGARPNEKQENVIWGWGKISQLTSRDRKFRDIFFDARYHVAVCRFLMGSALKSDAVMEQAVSDITKVAALYPDMGGAEQRQKFDSLLKEIQKRLGRKAEGLPPLQSNEN